MFSLFQARRRGCLHAHDRCKSSAGVQVLNTLKLHFERKDLGFMPMDESFTCGFAKALSQLTARET
jgi:hypothetical protein